MAFMSQKPMSKDNKYTGLVILETKYIGSWGYLKEACCQMSVVGHSLKCPFSHPSVKGNKSQDFFSDKTPIERTYRKRNEKTIPTYHSQGCSTARGF